MISQAILHTLSVVLTPSIHLPAPPSFYVTANNQIMPHGDIEYCECQLVTKILTQARLVNTENWILEWNRGKQEDICVRMGGPQALDFFELDSHVQECVRPILPIPIITINQAPPIYNLDFTEACPKSLCPLLPIIQTKLIPEIEDVFSPAPLLLENTQPEARSPSYHPSTPVHSPHPSDYHPLEDMEVDKWNGCADYASPPLIPIDASSSTDSLPSLQPLSSTTFNRIQYSTPSLTTNWKPEGGEHKWPPAGLANFKEIWPNPVNAIERWGSTLNAPFPSPSQSPVDLWITCPPRYITTNDSKCHR
ncbi:hypothetical protein JAAARDRAFT_198453 [Jaapia argillacea MUCL 33604]|uniref:Uncharacterized protein n=1 Tax=Jaapia argillacea MUCL 33604 TaxID=933084 RepID=A0A067PEK7_9AGAM|nr:hypothetical protein JAAARDRAFT_198453 [Jaapia argillacea MUCL 33604]